MASIKSPVKGFGGEVVGVRFKDGSATCTDEAKLNYFERQGYAVTGRPAPKAPEPPKDADPAAQFDPSEHSVEEVAEYLAGLPADDDGATERQRVFDAEKAGKARVSIIGPPDGDQKK